MNEEAKKKTKKGIEEKEEKIEMKKNEKLQSKKELTKKDINVDQKKNIKEADKKEVRKENKIEVTNVASVKPRVTEKAIKSKSKKAKIIASIIVITLIIILVIILTIMSLKSPKTITLNFFKALKEDNNVEISKYIDYTTITQYLYESETNSDIESELAKNCFSELEYKIDNVTINGDSATVTLTTTNKNFRNALTKWTQSVYKKFIAGESMTNDEQKTLLNQYILDNSIGTLTVSNDITLIKENKEWKIQNNDNLEDAIFPGLREVVNTMNSLINE